MHFQDASLTLGKASKCIKSIMAFMHHGQYARVTADSVSCKEHTLYSAKKVTGKHATRCLLQVPCPHWWHCSSLQTVRYKQQLQVSWWRCYLAVSEIKMLSSQQVCLWHIDADCVLRHRYNFHECCATKCRHALPCHLHMHLFLLADYCRRMNSRYADSERVILC